VAALRQDAAVRLGVSVSVMAVWFNDGKAHLNRVRDESKRPILSIDIGFSTASGGGMLI